MIGVVSVFSILTTYSFNDSINLEINVNYHFYLKILKVGLMSLVKYIKSENIDIKGQ